MAYSDVKWDDLCESEWRTRYDLDWAFEADHSDTDFDPCAEDASDDERYGADSAVANPNDGEQDIADPAVADPQHLSSHITLTPFREVKHSSTKLYAQRRKMQIFHTTPDTCSALATTTAIRNYTRRRADTIPCRYRMRDVHMATYVLGAKARPLDLVHALRKAGMPVIVLVFTEFVSVHHDIYKALKRWARIVQQFNGRQPPKGTEGAAVLNFLEDKRIFALGKRSEIFVCLHKDRVQTVTFEERVLSCCEQVSDEDLQFGTLTLHFHGGGVDPGDYVRIGIVVARFRLTDAQVDALAQWIILHRLAVLTGLFAHSHDYRNAAEYVWSELHNTCELNRDSPLTMLACKTRAVGSEPLFQQVDLAHCVDERQVSAIPVPWMFFGYEKAIKQPVSVPRPWIDARGLDFGDDVSDELMRQKHIPYWANNKDGHAYVPFLDIIRMTPVDWKHWFDGCFMTAVRIGRSPTPRSTHKKASRRLESQHLEKKRKIKRLRCHADEEEDSEN